MFKIFLGKKKVGSKELNLGEVETGIFNCINKETIAFKVRYHRKENKHWSRKLKYKYIIEIFF